MKIISENVCYVETEDLLRFPLPRFIFLPNELELHELVKFEGKEAIEYFKDRKDIIDYDLIYNIPTKNLERMIEETKEKLIKLSYEWLNSSKLYRIKLNQDKEYQLALKITKAIYESLCNYSINKDQIDFNMKSIEKNNGKQYQKIKSSCKLNF